MPTVQWRIAPAAWLRLAKATGNNAYLDFMIEHWWRTASYLYDPVEHLYFRDDRFFARRDTGRRRRKARRQTDQSCHHKSERSGARHHGGFVR